MLLLASRILEHELNDDARLRLLEKLQERGFTPLIRSARLSCFEQALAADAPQVEEMERLIAASLDSEAQPPYVQGDIFFFADHVLFLLFGGRRGEAASMRAGIVYEARTAEPLRKLNFFCQAISLCVGEMDAPAREDDAEGETQLMAWRQDWPTVQDGFVRFVVRQDPDILSAVACRENSRERVRASLLLEDGETRAFLRRAKEAYAEGYPMSASAEEAAGLPEAAADKLAEAGLLRREVLVSCRKSGHTLFSLPSADALAVVTISQARCSECGTAIADERVEEVLAPTQFSHVLLEDGAWLVNRLHSILRELGVSESEIAVEPPAGDGEARIMARVCDESFLIVMRDGDLTPAFARRAINTKLETDARCLLIVATGRIHNEGRMSLLGFAGRMERGGADFELMIADGPSAAAGELRRAFERVSRKALAEQLCLLDASLGLSVPHLITTRFQMLANTAPAALPAATAAPRDRELPDRAAPPEPDADLIVLENAER